MADDFCKFFDTMMGNYTLKSLPAAVCGWHNLLYSEFIEPTSY